MKLLLILFAFAASAFGQCGPLAWNPVTSELNCTGASASGTVTSVVIAGTANQITASGTCTITSTGTCTLSIPSVFTLPGTINKLTLTAPATAATLTLIDGTTTTGPAVTSTLVGGGNNITVVGGVAFRSSDGILTTHSGLAYNSALGAGRLTGAEIRATGLVGIGTYLVDSADATPYIDVTTSGKWQFLSRTTGTSGLVILNAGATVGVGAGNNAPTGTLHIKNTTASTGATSVTIAKGAADSASTVTLTSDAKASFAGGIATGSAYLFATLPAVSNGTLLYCSDCTVTSGADNTCAGSGSGALVVDLNSVHRCFNAQN